MKQIYQIKGMTCAACVRSIERAVQKVDAVDSVTVNLLTHSMTVFGRASSEAVIYAVQKAGYEALISSCPPMQQPHFSPTISDNASVTAKRLLISFLCLLALMYLSMGSMLGLPIPSFFTGHENAITFSLTQLLLTLPICYANRSCYKRGIKALFHRSPNMDTLIAVGTFAAMAYGVAAIIGIGHGLAANDDAMIARWHMDLYFESAAMILTLTTLGKFLEARSRGKTGQAIQRLMQLTPQTACVIREQQELIIPAEQLVVGDLVIVRPGQSIPADGIVVDGTASVDESTVTGESLPVNKQKGSKVTAATINRSGAFRFRATQVGQDTTLAQMIELVQTAISSKAPIAKLADAVSGIFVPTVLVIALLTFITWLALGASFEFAFSCAIGVLVISCPCALGLATPLAIMAGTGRGAEHGILIKSGEALELAHRIDTVVLDKTGTVTLGQPRVTDFYLAKGQNESAFWQAAASIEYSSEHPLAYAILQKAKEQGFSIQDTNEFEAILGKGICAYYQGQLWHAGNEAMMTEHNITLPQDMLAAVEEFSADGKTPLLFACEKQIAGVVAVSDPLKPDSPMAVKQLLSMGIDVILLTGDRASTAEAIQKQAGIPHVIAQVTPQEKERVIADLQARGKTVAMVGDGINDAPALARSDVGIALGAGTDIAIDSANIVLVKSNLSEVPAAIHLSKAVLRNIKQNLFWAFFYNIIGIPLAAGVFFLPFSVRLSPMFGAAAMSLSGLLVAINALRLTKIPLYPIKTSNHISVSSTLYTEQEKPMKTILLHIHGMMCEHCTAHVTRALQIIDNRLEVQVSLAQGTANCKAPAEISAEQLKCAIEEAGYEVISCHES